MEVLTVVLVEPGMETVELDVITVVETGALVLDVDPMVDVIRVVDTLAVCGT